MAETNTTPLNPETLVQKKNLTYEQMLELLNVPSYQARDDAALQQITQNMYAPQYNAEMQASQQGQQKTDLSLQNQLSALLTNVGAQRDALNQNVQSALSQQQQSALGRGMQRSSFNQAALGGIQQQGVKLQDQISQNLLQQQSGIESQRQQLAQQLAETLGRLSVDKTTNENNLMQQLRDQDYERGMTATDMSNQIYQWLAGSYWPMAKKEAGLPKALMPKQESRGGVSMTSSDFWSPMEMEAMNALGTVVDPNAPKPSSGSGSKPKPAATPSFYDIVNGYTTSSNRDPLYGYTLKDMYGNVVTSEY